MKIISSFMDDLHIEIGGYHTITFDSTETLSNFRELLQQYFQNKTQSECLYLKVLDNESNTIKGKDFYFISFDCNIISLEKEKTTTKLLQDLLFYYLENNPDILKDYINFNSQINQFVGQIEMSNNYFSIEFQSTEKTITNFIKSLEITIDYKEKGSIPNYRLREYLVESLLEMNVSGKEVILLITYPETDAGLGDLSKVIAFLQNINVTTIVITANQTILTAATVNNMFMVNKNGHLYDVINLSKELLAFGFAEESDLPKLAKMLAFRDFMEDYYLLNNEMKKFLLSSRL